MLTKQKWEVSLVGARVIKTNSQERSRFAISPTLNDSLLGHAQRSLECLLIVNMHVFGSLVHHPNTECLPWVYRKKLSKPQLSCRRVIMYVLCWASSTSSFFTSSSLASNSLLLYSCQSGPPFRNRDIQLLFLALKFHNLINYSEHMELESWKDMNMEGKVSRL